MFTVSNHCACKTLSRVLSAACDNPVWLQVKHFLEILNLVFFCNVSNFENRTLEKIMIRNPAVWILSKYSIQTPMILNLLHSL